MKETEANDQLLLGRYRILREIGRGGMATVHLAEDVRDGSKVAVKRLRLVVANAVNTQRFLREIDVARSLDHPRILHLMDSGTGDDDLPFYVMPYVDGESLKQRLGREKQLPIDEAIALVRQAGDALVFAHEQGVLHRDVSPGNILIDRSGAYLADFGIARAMTEDAQALTSTGVVIGTPEYMSPEQSTGERTLDARADLFSLASVLYATLAGEPPYTGPSAQAILARKATNRAHSVRELRPLVPMHVDHAIARALEPLPADRQPSVAQFLGELDPPAGASSSAPPSWSWREMLRSIPRVMWTVVLIIGTVGVGVVLGFALRSDFDATLRDLRAGQIASPTAALSKRFEADSSRALVGLWLAQAMLLSGTDTSAAWKRVATLSAARAAAAAFRSDAMRARALRDLAAHDLPKACDEFRQLGKDEPSDATALFDLAACIARDTVVVRDNGSPSGWRFRSSRSEGIALYLRAIDRSVSGSELHVVILRRLQSLLVTEMEPYRLGVGAADTLQVFGAFAEIVAPGGDSVTFTPHPISEFRAEQPWMRAPGHARAVEHDRELLRTITARWVKEFPASSEAQAAYARAHDVSGRAGDTTRARLP